MLLDGKAVQLAAGEDGQHALLAQECDHHLPEDAFELAGGEVHFDPYFLKDPMHYMCFFHEQQLLQVVAVDVLLVVPLQAPHQLVEHAALALVATQQSQQRRPALRGDADVRKYLVYEVRFRVLLRVLVRVGVAPRTLAAPLPQNLPVHHQRR